jgi:hypothetical protein
MKCAEGRRKRLVRPIGRHAAEPIGWLMLPAVLWIVQKRRHSGRPFVKNLYEDATELKRLQFKKRRTGEGWLFGTAIILRM